MSCQRCEALLALVDQLRQETARLLKQRAEDETLVIRAHEQAEAAEEACARLRTALEALPHYSEAEVGRLPSTLDWVLVDDLEAALSLPSEGSRQ